MALCHIWDVKNDFAYVLQFFSLISDGLGILIYISGLKSDRVIATIYNDTDEFTVQRKQAMVYDDNGNFENFHEY